MDGEWPALDNRVCSSDNLGRHICDEGTYCGNPKDFGISLADDGVYDDAQIMYGYVTFNDIFSSLLLVN